MAGCALQIASLVAGLEAGAQPNPVFFAGPDCNVSQYPAQGDQLLPSFFNGQKVNLRELACRIDPGGLAAPVRENILHPSVSVASCPIPAIRSIIIPDDIILTFFAPDQDDIRRVVEDPGIFVLHSKKADTAKRNVYVINTSNNNPAKWGTSKNSEVRPGTEKCKYSGPEQVTGFFSSSGKMQTSLISCGQSFWPSLTSAYLTGNNSQPYYLEDNNTRYVKGVAGTKRSIGFASQYSYCRTPFGWNAGCAAGAYVVENWTTCAGPGAPTSYSTGDCINDRSGVANARNNFDHPTLFCTAGNNRFYPNEQRCLCGSETALNGSVEHISLEFAAGSWEAQQFAYCAGSPMTLGGIKIKRYGPGTPACDAIVPGLCANLAFMTTTPGAAKACTCVNEEIRLKTQFAGLNMPVQCFSSVCSTSELGIYRTSAQLEGCSARICRQIIYISGSQISAEGYQELLCNSQVYSIEAAIPIFPTESEQNSNDSLSSGVVLGPEFYISLALLGFMVVLLIVFFIRSFVTSRRARQQENAQILQSLRSVVQQSA